MPTRFRCPIKAFAPGDVNEAFSHWAQKMQFIKFKAIITTELGEAE